jgi:hypothetical protein
MLLWLLDMRRWVTYSTLSQVHPCLFICIVQFNVCASCYTNKDSSVIEIEGHKMGHPVVKWTLNPRSGQRQWTESEAHAVLEDLRTVVWVHYDHQEVEKKAEEGNAKVEEKEGRNEEGENGEGGNEEEGGVIAARPPPAELWIDVDETHGEPGRFSPFQHDETMEHLNQDAKEGGGEERGNEGEGEGEQEGWNEQEGEEEERGNGGGDEEEQEGWNEEGEEDEGGRRFPPFQHDETMEHLNQDAEEEEDEEGGNEGEEGEQEGWNKQEGEEEERGDEGEDEDEGEGWNEQVDDDEARGSEEEGGGTVAGAALASEFGLDGDETHSEAGEVPPFSGDETMAYLNHDAQETEPGNQAKDEDPVDGREEVILVVVQHPVDPPRSYTCGRCSKGIDLDSTFYRCVGHLCCGTFMRQF